MSVLVVRAQAAVQLRQACSQGGNVLLVRRLELPEVILVDVSDRPGLDAFKQLHKPLALVSPVFGAHRTLHFSADSRTSGGHSTCARAPRECLLSTHGGHLPSARFRQKPVVLLA